MRYALLICNDENAEISAEDSSRRAVGFAAFQDEMRARGVLLGSERLRPDGHVHHRAGMGGDVVIADGPFAETKEQIAGFFLVDCKDLDEAIEVAAKIPAAWYGTIEVRPVWEM